AAALARPHSGVAMVTLSLPTRSIRATARWEYAARIKRGPARHRADRRPQKPSPGRAPGDDSVASGVIQALDTLLVVAAKVGTHVCRGYRPSPDDGYGCA